MTTGDRNANPMNAATKAISIVRPSLSLSIMRALLRADDHRQAGDRDLVVGILRPHGVELLIDPVDDRQQLAGVGIRNTPADDDGILLRRNEPARQIGRQQVDILLERVDVRFVHFLGEPAPQRIERPDIADPRLALEQRMDVGN